MSASFQVVIFGVLDLEGLARTVMTPALSTGKLDDIVIVCWLVDVVDTWRLNTTRQMRRFRRVDIRPR